MTALVTQESVRRWHFGHATNFLVEPDKDGPIVRVHTGLIRGSVLVGALSGTLPGLISSFTSLVKLQLSRNAISGTVAASVASLTALSKWCAGLIRRLSVPPLVSSTKTASQVQLPIMNSWPCTH